MQNCKFASNILYIDSNKKKQKIFNFNRHSFQICLNNVKTLFTLDIINKIIEHFSGYEIFL